jgi:energy-coupling factor transport system substrate-specific component
MVVLVAVTAALYVVTLLPFKIATIVPGFTEIRPGAAVPVICSLLFGPLAAWGAAIGNLVGDMYGGMLTLGSIGGFIGNFFYGLLPFLIWRRLMRREPQIKSASGLLVFFLACLVSSAVCAAVIGAGLMPIPRL